ncbi:aminotransferase class I/II-fold pyridoxal phosphate-dependent enzyme [Streptomyces chrestomyceticus]|uniref:aminotransferase class I/II-fold pyridoxal phosphate-dependent enzyme n=1 Tax=Streptomyces chrestomyceticus TaxID=68185 RepID=UPI0036909DBD
MKQTIAPIRPAHTAHEARYDLRGPLAERAADLRAQGHDIIDLHLGDPAAHGLDAPDAVLRAAAEGLHRASAYSDERGLPAAREAIADHYRQAGLVHAAADRVFLGNGVSELASLSLQALLDPGDTLLVPAPGYPLWPACATLIGATPVPYRCREDTAWAPDPDELAARAGPRTRAIVVINPGNPTGAHWPPAVLESIADLARRRHLMLLSDEIYAELCYPGTEHIPLAALAPDVPCLTFGGLSKYCRLPGYRAGWAVASGPRPATADYLQALTQLASLRMCPNVPAQHAIPTALSPDVLASTRQATTPGGTLTLRRDALHNALTLHPGIRCTRPDGAFYTFPRLPLPPDVGDEAFTRYLLEHHHVLATPGAQFDPPGSSHIRLSALAPPETLDVAAQRIHQALGELER